MPYDRDEVLARTDLGALADEVLGPRRGRGRTGTWPCPDPGHGPQSGRTPPVSMFRSPAGHERWRCHACAAGGTAADLVMTTQGVGFADAIALLAARAGVDRHQDLPALRPKVTERAVPAQPVRSREIAAHVSACEAYLWSPSGGRMRHWLGRRGLGDEVLRVNRVGADPGPRLLARPPGLPRSGPAVILPILDPDGVAVYLQARYLYPPGGRKYDNPTAALAGPSPRLAELRLARRATDPSIVLVCEGLPDGLIAAQAGYRATALLGAGLPDERVARTLVERFAAERLVVALDADDRGRAGSARLVELLTGAGAPVAVAEVPPTWGDLNGWYLATGGAFGRELARAVDAARPPGPVHPAISEGLTAQLDAIRHRHVMVEDPLLAARSLADLRRVVARWERTGIGTEHSGSDRPRSGIERDLDDLIRQRLPGADPRHAQSDMAAVKAAVTEWSTGLDATRVGFDGPAALTTTVHATAVSAPLPDRSLGIDL